MNPCKVSEQFPAAARAENELEQRMADRFTVHPIHARKAWEEFTFMDDEVARVVFVVFGLVMRGRADECAQKLADELWKTMKKAYPPGAFLVWRRCPEVSEYELEGGWRTRLTLRIGGFEPPKVGAVSEGTDWAEHEPIP